MRSRRARSDSRGPSVARTDEVLKTHDGRRGAARVPGGWRRVLIATLAILSGALQASAQITTGSVVGSIKDDQGLALPGATVTLVSEARGTRMAPAVSNASGDFVVPNVTPDTYTIEVSMSGFKSLRRTGVAVSGGDRVGLGELTLAVGGTSETITVTAEKPIIQSQSGERSFRVTTTEVENLPIGTARNFSSLTSLTPGVTGTTTRLGGGGSEQHHDGRRVHDGHRQQRPAAQHEPRGDRRGEGAHGGLSGRVRPVERPADHRRDQERQQQVPGLGLRRAAQFGLELELVGQQDQRHAQGGRQAVGLGLHGGRAGRPAGRRQQAVLLLRPGVSSAERGQYAAAVPRADPGRTQRRFLGVARQQRRADSRRCGTRSAPGLSATGSPRAACIRPASTS